MDDHLFINITPPLHLRAKENYTHNYIAYGLEDTGDDTYFFVYDIGMRTFKWMDTNLFELEDGRE